MISVEGCFSCRVLGTSDGGSDVIPGEKKLGPRLFPRTVGLSTRQGPFLRESGPPTLVEGSGKSFRSEVVFSCRVLGTTWWRGGPFLHELGLCSMRTESCATLSVIPPVHVTKSPRNRCSGKVPAVDQMHLVSPPPPTPSQYPVVSHDVLCVSTSTTQDVGLSEARI
jgi:hypothetical protein